MNLQPVSGVARNPILGLVPADMRYVPVGAALYELMPDGECVLCQLNGEWVPYEHFARRVAPGDVIAWHVRPQGREGFRAVLTIAAVLASIIPGLQPFAPYLYAAAFAYNLLLPPIAARAPQQQQPGDSVYTTSLQGNQARLNQPIWKVCGRRKIQPPFAGMPYQEWVGDVDAKQYYSVVFAATLGNADVEAVLIGGTPISNFQDVIISAVVTPGQHPTQARADVETSTVVSANTLESGQYAGGFVACKPQRTCRSIGIDISAVRGITQAMTWRVEVRAVNDFGVPLSGWSILATESSDTRTGGATTNTPQQWSYLYTLPAAIRPQVRVARTDLKNTAATALHELAWIGLRGYLSDTAELDPDTQHHEVVLRGSAQLSQYSQRDFSMILQAKCRTWAAGVWGLEVYTRNPGWWALDLATSTVWGLGLDDDRVDLQGFADFAAACDARQDRFDYCFDTAIPAWDALQIIARAGRARCFRRNGVLTIARDELEDAPITAFTSRNTEPDSMTTVEALPTLERADGFVIEYEDNRTWQWTPVECPCPGVSVTNPDDPRYDAGLPAMANPIRKRIEGITGAMHALREGLYEAANLLYRTRQVSCKTEMEGILPAYMSPVRWQPDIVGYGQTGDVAFWNSATLVMGLTEPVAWGADDLYLRLRRDDGTLTDPVRVTPGPDATDIILPAAPDFSIVVDSGTRERPMFVLGPLVGGDELVKVTAITDGGKGQEGEQLFELRGLIDDDRVHAADNAYLPGPGDIQDPVDTTPDAAESSEVYIVSMADHSVIAYNTSESDSSASITFRNDGTLTTAVTGDTAGFTPASFPNEWMLFGAVAPAVAALYEVRATYLGGSEIFPASGYLFLRGTPTPPTSGTLDTWQNLGTSRTWTLALPGSIIEPFAVVARLRIEIREAASGIVQASQTITLFCQQILAAEVGVGA